MGFPTKFAKYLYYFILPTHLTTDINECSEDMSNCSHLENCRDTVGGYECDCIEGYQKNGFMCEGK